MRRISQCTKSFTLAVALVAPAWSGLSAQTQTPATELPQITVTGTHPPDLAALPRGPVIKGMISARKGNRVQIAVMGGAKTVVTVTEGTRIRALGGFLGASTRQLGVDELLNGLPVTIDTLEWDGGLVASRVTLQSKDLKFATMIRNGTDQRFDEQSAATEALRSRVADIDNYNVKGTTNVTFDSGKYALSPQAKSALCSVAAQAEATTNSLLLVIGYTDSTGSAELNQTLSEKRAASVVNYLQQACHWKPYRMLTPTGMAAADPTADNNSSAGKAMNRRVAVNILVSKAADGM
jgi:outer membrane protein OmpA-like peptidoglycan-associated protein